MSDLVKLGKRLQKLATELDEAFGKDVSRDYDLLDFLLDEGTYPQTCINYMIAVGKALENVTADSSW